MPLLSVEGVSKRFDGVTAVDQVSFAVDRGQVVGFLGPNGAGKSTTMRMITQYYEPDTGDIKLDGVPLAIKDLRLALAEAEHEAVPMPAASLVHDRLVAMVARGWAGLDWSALGLLAAVDAGLGEGR